MEEHKLCLKDMDRAIQLDPNNPFRYSSRAYIRGHLKYTHDAIKDYQKALELDPDDAVTLNNLGLLEEQLGRMDAAKQRYKQADDLTKNEKHEGPDETIKKLIEESTPIQNAEEGKELEEKRQQKELEKKRETIAPKATPKKPEYLKTAKEVFTQKTVFKEFITFVINTITGKNKK
jgi:tetratricopeptide (TPR) repeat protein